MNAIVVRSPRALAKPRQVEIVKYTPAAAIILKGMVAAVARGVRGATDLAVRAKDAVVTQPRQAKWVYATQVEAPEPPPAVVPVPLAEPRQVKVEKFLNFFD
jgi:hypothetical protein